MIQLLVLMTRGLIIQSVDSVVMCGIEEEEEMKHCTVVRVPVSVNALLR